MAQLRSVTCHMGSHSVTCYPTQANTPRLNPSHAGRYSIYLPRRDGRLSWPNWLDSSRAGSRTCDLSITSPTLNQCNHQDNPYVLCSHNVQRHRQRRHYNAPNHRSSLQPADTTNIQQHLKYVEQHQQLHFLQTVCVSVFDFCVSLFFFFSFHSMGCSAIFK